MAQGRRRNAEYARGRAKASLLSLIVAVATDLPGSITEPDVAGYIHKFYEEYAIPAESFARAVAFAISQAPEVDANEILFRPTRQEA